MKLKIVLVSIVITLSIFATLSCMKKSNVVMRNEKTIDKLAWGIQLPNESTGKMRDADISSAIKQKFSEDKLISDSNINVDTTNGTVTLNGKVSSQMKIHRAVQLGRSAKGVKSVRSNLIVD